MSMCVSHRDYCSDLTTIEFWQGATTPHAGLWLRLTSGTICERKRAGSVFGTQPAHTSDERDRQMTEHVSLKGIPSNSKSGYRGVYWHDPSQSWVALTQVNGRRVSLGLFACIEDAAEAYAKAIKAHRDAKAEAKRTYGPLIKISRLKTMLAKMQVGDSVFIAGDNQPLNRNKAYNAASFYACMHGVRFHTKKVDGGVRIWRVE